ncbi:Uncharacterised protein [Megamonas hypermegale]|uniref:Uncharacterized protein n=1 Tax=Megamonas hypermegale TaxID=158847 RepID=A0A239U4G3_9FIRM|nr:Uncharacterised protein [Megamonas hypermegale]
MGNKSHYVAISFFLEQIKIKLTMCYYIDRK